MKSIRSLPCEIIGLILANCESFAELLDAILTCRSFYSAWKSHTGSILWHIGQLEIIGFRDALIAVRATEIAKQAIFKEDLPPSPFPLGELSGQVRKPTLDELKVLFDFRHLVECLERVARENSPHTGAALYRVYQEPLTLASTCGLPGFLDKFRKNMEEWDEEHDYHDDPFTPAEKRCLLQYPIFRFEEFQYHGDIFQPLADIFFQESKSMTKVVNTLRGASLYERLEEIIMPENVEDAVETFVLAHPGVESPVVDKANLPGLEYASRNLRLLLDAVKYFSGQSNCYWPDCGTPPPDLQFVRYMLAKYFLLRFKDNTWDRGNSRNNDSRTLAWSKFTVSGDVFCERILAKGYDEACALLESINAPLPEPYFVHNSCWFIS
ncbi:hypothetical protein CNMCM5878_008513 [Aspergillus fumigatiaffinis]|nr:hypothetical protein CNMCM5878_008513 [Aspergillus fumigatiaffinis]